MAETAGPRTFTRVAVATALAGVLVLGAAACGGGGDDDAGEATTTTAAVADGTTAPATGDGFVEQADAACTRLNDELSGGVQTALLSTRDLANSVQTTDPAALEPVFASIESSFGSATELVTGLRADFAAIDAPADAAEPLATADGALADVEGKLDAVAQAATDQDLAAVGRALADIQAYDPAALEGAFTDLAALGATACQPAA